jgi:hypothetical protein
MRLFHTILLQTTAKYFEVFYSILQKTSIGKNPEKSALRQSVATLKIPQKFPKVATKVATCPRKEPKIYEKNRGQKSNQLAEIVNKNLIKQQLTKHAYFIF